MAYDPAKAEAFNRARAQGLTYQQAARAAGLTAGEIQNYSVGSNGQMGPTSQVIAGPTDSQGRPVEVLTGDAAAQARAEDAAFYNSGLPRNTPYAQTANTTPGTITTREYTESSTTSISGGGSTTIVATPGRPTAASQAADAQAQQTQREIEALQLANSGFGPGPQLSEEQQAANDARILQLQQQYNAQREEATSAREPTPPSITTVPNTTTTINSVAYERSVEVTPVNSDDPAQIARSTEAGAVVTVNRSLAAPSEVSTEDDPTLRTPTGEEETGAVAETGLAEPLDVDTNQDRNLSDEEILARQNAGGLSNGEILARQQPVNPSVDPGIGGTAYDDNGNLNPGWTLDENNNPVFVGGNFVEPATAESAAASRTAAAKQNTINQATLQSRYRQPGNTDWRVRLSLAPTSDYLYNAGGNDPNAAGILAPLRTTNGVVFPYTPTIGTSYQANYEQYDLIHSNYRGIYYKNSRVNDISVRGMFTAQDTTEANYLLAVIHFFRSVTKMFYGQDANRGVPPPLVFLSGFGNFQFSDHPCVVTSFNYTLPNDVDYIRATNFNNYGGNLFNRRQPIATAPGGVQFAGAIRLANALLPKNAQPQTPTQNTLTASVTNTDRSTYVPTKMEIDINLIPVQTRDQVSNQFSLKEFANGNLIKKGFW